MELDSVLESKVSKWDSNLFLDSESAWDSVRLDSKPTRDSIFSLHSVFGFAPLLQAKISIVQVEWVAIVTDAVAV